MVYLEKLKMMLKKVYSVEEVAEIIINSPFENSFDTIIVDDFGDSDGNISDVPTENLFVARNLFLNMKNHHLKAKKLFQTMKDIHCQMIRN